MLVKDADGTFQRICALDVELPDGLVEQLHEGRSIIISSTADESRLKLFAKWMVSVECNANET